MPRRSKAIISAIHETPRNLVNHQTMRLGTNVSSHNRIGVFCSSFEDLRHVSISAETNQFYKSPSDMFVQSPYIISADPEPTYGQAAQDSGHGRILQAESEASSVGDVWLVQYVVLADRKTETSSNHCRLSDLPLFPGLHRPC